MMGQGVGVYGLCHVLGLSLRRTEFYPRHVLWGLVVDNEAFTKALLGEQQFSAVSTNRPVLDTCTLFITKAVHSEQMRASLDNTFNP